MENENQLAEKLTKLEYAMIHSSWMPSDADVNAEYSRDRQKNPYNESHRPRLRSQREIINDLRIAYFKGILSATQQLNHGKEK